MIDAILTYTTRRVVEVWWLRIIVNCNVGIKTIRSTGRYIVDSNDENNTDPGYVSIIQPIIMKHLMLITYNDDKFCCENAMMNMMMMMMNMMYYDDQTGQLEK